MKAFNRDRDEVMERCRAKLEGVVDCGVGAGGIEKSLALSEEHPGFVHPVLGLHPFKAGRMGTKEVDRTLGLIKENAHRAVALGETGLEFYHTKDKVEMKRQETVFTRFIDLAKDVDKPLVVHARDGEKRALELAVEGGAEKVLFHCFGGSIETAKAVLDAGYYMSFATNLCFSREHQEVLGAIGLDGVLLETDSPYLSPRRDEKRNEPGFIYDLVEKAAEVTGMETDEAEKIATANTKRFYGIG